MKIAIDLRGLQSGSISGVENYTLNLLEHLIPKDTANQYTLFYNSLRPVQTDSLQYVNSTVVRTKIPNKLLNLGLRFFDFPRIEQLTGPFDVFFMPNMNHIALGKDKKLVITIHDLSFLAEPSYYNLKRKLWHWSLGLKALLARADCICAVSEFTKQDLMRYLQIPEHKIKVIYPGVDTRTFKPQLPTDQLRAIRNKYSLPGDYIVFINTIEPRKNLVGLIEAFELVPGSTELVIGGKLGWKYKESMRRMRQSKKSKFIKYLGYVPEADKAAIMKLAKVLAYPSFYEGFGFQPLEAMALGVPVVCTQVTSLPEAVGDAAIMVDPRSTTDIARALTAATMDESLRRHLISKGYEQAAEFSWDAAAQGMLEVFNTLYT